MAARSMSTGTISFGLVTVPIRLYAASEIRVRGLVQPAPRQVPLAAEAAVHLHRRTRRSSPATEMVKGFEFAKDQYVVFTEDEIKAMAEESTRTIEITEFVPIVEGRPRLLRGRLLPRVRTRAARRPTSSSPRPCGPTGRCALAKWAARGKGYLVLLRPFESGLVMQVLHFADEVRPFTEVPVGDAAVQERRAEAGRAAHRADLHATSSIPRTTRTRSAPGTTRPSSARSRARRSPRRRSRSPRPRSSTSWRP